MFFVCTMLFFIALALALIVEDLHAIRNELVPKDTPDRASSQTTPGKERL